MPNQLRNRPLIPGVTCLTADNSHPPDERASLFVEDKMKAETLMKTAFVDLEKKVNRMSSRQCDDLRRELEGIAERASMMSGYLDERAGYGCGDQGHDSAVKEANRRGKVVWMNVFGYNGYHEIRF